MYRLDAQLVEAIEARRTIIVPTRQRAAAVRLAYAWRQRAAGSKVWRTPDVIAWEAWLSRELSRARQRLGTGPALLNPSQELALWQTVVVGVAESDEQGDRAFAHAESIATAAILAREWRLEWPSHGVPDEALLLQRAMAAMDEHCRAQGVLSSRFAGDDAITNLEPASLAFAGFERLTPRQLAVSDRFTQWGFDSGLLEASAQQAEVHAFSYGVAVDEVAAVGRWCHGHLTANPDARLLLICADRNRDLHALRDGLVAALAPGAGPEVADGVVVEGGTPLLRQPLVSTAAGLLALSEGDIESAKLGALLMSPYHSLADLLSA
ncbi:MAG: hypothetical protein ABW136_01515, partial [Steroidobacteraceae bacterium]